MALNEQQLRFVEEYLSDPDMNATAAYRRAYPSCKSNDAATANASRLLASAKVRAELNKQRQERAERTKITQDKVLRQFWAIATADPNELIEHRRVCCRHCWGRNHLYQRTELEMERDRTAHAKLAAKFKPAEGKEPPGDFNEEGGIGYDERQEPNPNCPVCFGDGVGKVIAKDTRRLSPAARRLYAGVKVTKDGLEVKTHDQMAALVNVGKLQGYFTDNVKVTASVKWDLSKLTDDELRDLAAIAERVATAGINPVGDVAAGVNQTAPAVPLEDGAESVG